MWFFIVLLVVGAILLGIEYLARHKGLHAELNRKLVHILVGSFAASWPFILSWRQIQLLSVLALVVMVVSVKFNVFRAIHGVDRGVAGELLAVVAVALLSFITTQPWIFTAAMLTLGVADGLAAVIGVLWGEDNEYKVFGQVRSVAGSLAFFFTTLIIMVCYAAFSGESYSAVTIVWLPVLATIAENLAVRGTDNLVVPLLVALVLSS